MVILASPSLLCDAALVSVFYAAMNRCHQHSPQIQRLGSVVSGLLDTVSMGSFLFTLKEFVGPQSYVYRQRRLV